MNNSEYRQVLTEDGSYSLYSENFGELMHTRHGAYLESLEKHVYPSLILGRAEKPVNVLDIGFGMGYNLLALLSNWQYKTYLHVDSFEFDRKYSRYLHEVRFNDERDGFYDKIISAFENGIYKDNDISIEIHFGDARSNLLEISKKGILYDAVFQDPFSPVKNCELWTLDYFKLIYRLMANDAVLTTYSNAFQVRRAMSEAGFYICRNLNNSFKKEGTLCFKNQEIYKPLDQSELQEIFLNVKSLTFRDENLSLPREEIYSRRNEKIAQLTKDRQARS